LISERVTTAPTPFDLYRSGDFHAAEEAARAALAAGDDARLRQLLGVLLCRRGNLEEGAQELGRALEATPANASVRLGYVRALIDCGRGEEALRHALRPAPGPMAAELWRLRSEAAQAAAALPEQIEAERNAELEELSADLQARPADRRLLLRRGRLLGAVQRNEEAIETYRSVLQADPADSAAVWELGLLLERAGDVDALRTMIDSALAAGVDPKDVAFLQALSAWRAREAEKAREYLIQADPAKDLIRFHQLQAKIEDALGNPVAAFRAAEAKNRSVSRRPEWIAQAASFRARMRDLAAAVTPEWAKAFVPSEPGGQPAPTFLLGFPRSGTTLLDTFLMGHPDLAVLEEIPLMGVVAEAFGPLQRVPDMDNARADELRGMYLKALERHLPAGFDGLVVDKMPLNLLCAPLIYRLFPNAKIVFAQRHPCDCVLSGFLQSFNLNPAMASFLDLADAADLYDVALDIWSRSEAALPLNVHRTVYERMVQAPEDELRALIGFLGLEWNAELLDHRTAAKARGRIPTASYDQVAEPLTTQPVGRWRRYETQLQPVLPVLLPWAERLGYDR